MKKVLTIIALVAVLVPCLACSCFAFYPGFIGDSNSMYTEATGSQLTELVLKDAQLFSGGVDRGNVVLAMSEYIPEGHSEISFNYQGYQLSFGLYAYEKQSSNRYCVDINDPNSVYAHIPEVASVLARGSDVTVSAHKIDRAVLFEYLGSSDFLPWWLDVQSSSSNVGTAFPSKMSCQLAVTSYSLEGEKMLGSEYVEATSTRSTSTNDRLIPTFKNNLVERVMALASKIPDDCQYFTVKITSLELECSTLLSQGYFTPELIRLSVAKPENIIVPTGLYLGGEVVPNMVEVINPLDAIFGTTDAFLKIELLPNVTLGTILSLVVAVPAVIALLKMFAGG